MKPELIAPAGNEAMLASAINAGATGVYFGIKDLNMRVNAGNFELSQLKNIVARCHKAKVKAYLAINTIIYENELDKLKKIVAEAKKAKVDAIIAWDQAVLEECKKQKVNIHISTQASISNFNALESYYKRFNIKRAVLARECSLNQIKEITKKIKKHKLKVDIEAFIHGAMCVSVSGRCFTSQFTFGRSANRGDCLQNCRREYTITDEENNKLILKNNYVMSAKDLCTIEFLDKLTDAGISAFKIEGRNRSPEYVKTVTECYRKMIDYLGDEKKKNIAIKNNPIKKKTIKAKEKLTANLIKKLKTVYNRDFSTGFYLNKPINEFTDAYGSKAVQKKFYIGKVKNFYHKIKVAEILVEDNPPKTKDKILIIGNKTGTLEDTIGSMELEHKKITQSKKGQRIAVKLKETVRINDKVFKIFNV